MYVVMSCHCNCIELSEMHDVERKRKLRENLWAQAEAVMHASSNHFTVLVVAKILRTKTRYDFRFLATVP